MDDGARTSRLAEAQQGGEGAVTDPSLAHCTSGAGAALALASDETWGGEAPRSEGAERPW